MNLKLEVFGMRLSPSLTPPSAATKLKLCLCFPSDQCVSHVLNQFQRVHMEKFWLWILTPPTAAVLSTIVVSVCVCDIVFLRLYLQNVHSFSHVSQCVMPTCALNHL